MAGAAVKVTRASLMFTSEESYFYGCDVPMAPTNAYMVVSIPSRNSGPRLESDHYLAESAVTAPDPVSK